MSPKSNFRLARYKLRTLKQEADEPVDSFLKKARVLVKECKFTNPDEHIIDALIFGSSNKRVQSKLLEHDDSLTLDKAIDIARTQEATKHQLQDITGNTTSQIHALRHGTTSAQNPAHKTPGQQARMCGNCGKHHDLSQRSLCPAYGTKCKACGKDNHWKQVCRSNKPSKGNLRAKSNHARPRDKQHQRRQDIHTLETTERTSDNSAMASQLYFDTITLDHSESRHSGDPPDTGELWPAHHSPAVQDRHWG